MYSAIAIVAAILAVGALYYLFTKKQSLADPILKSMAIAIFAIGLVRFLLADAFVETVFDFSLPLESFLRWGYYISYAVVPISIFRESRLFRNIATYFTTTMALLSMIFIENTMVHFMSSEAGGLHMPLWFRYVFYILELVLVFSTPILGALHNRHVIDFKNRKEWIHIAIGLPAMLLQMMPVYIPQSLVGLTDIPYGSFSPFHLTWIALIGVECVVLWLVFRKRSTADKYNLLLFLVIAQVYHTCSIFLRGFTPHRMPIQLCSIAAFFYLFTIVMRSRRVFGFCFLVNIVGGVIAIVLAAFDVGAFAFWTFHYIYEHTFVMLVPILAASLGVFPRMERKDLYHALKIFAIYFFCCLIAGSIFNGVTGEFTVNYFYMFDYEVALEYVPFATFTGVLEVPFFNITLYPILILVILVVFNLLIIGFYALMQGLYRLTDAVRQKNAPTQPAQGPGTSAPKASAEEAHA